MSNKGKYEQEYYLSKQLENLEKYHVDNLLKEDFKELYLDVLKNLKEFREEIFKKNVEIIDNGVAILDDKYIPHTINMGKSEESLKKIRLIPELYKFYKEKALKLKEEKKA